MSQIGDAVVRRDTSRNPVCRARRTRSSARSAVIEVCRGLLALPTAASSASTAGSLMPDRLRCARSVGRAANRRAARGSSSVGVAANDQRLEDDVEVEIALPRADIAPGRPGGSRRRCRSPSCSRPRAMRCARRPRRRPGSRPRSGSPLSLTTQLPIASSRPRRAAPTPAPSSLRSRPVPSVSGGTTASPKTSGGSRAAERLEQREFLRRRACPSAL